MLLGRNYRPKACYTDKEHEVLFRSKTPLKLNDSVSGRKSRSSSSHCVQEMFNMMACLKNQDFEQSNCLKEIQIFNQCNGSQRPVEFRISKKNKEKLNAESSQANLSTVQLNEYLKKFPT